MSTYPLQTLLNQWAKCKFTVEQAIGHVFQHLDAQIQRIQALEQRVRKLEQKLDADE